MFARIAVGAVLVGAALFAVFKGGFVSVGAHGGGGGERELFDVATDVEIEGEATEETTTEDTTSEHSSFRYL